MRRTVIWLPWLLLFIVIGGFLIWQQQLGTTHPVNGQRNVTSEKNTPLLSTAPQGGVVSYNQAVKVAAPAVVNIFTTQKVVAHPQIEDPVLRKFFERQFPQESSNEDETSLGSGVIVSQDGYILTNNHVVAQADQIVVALQDGRRATAKVIGTDPDTDLAVIKIGLNGLPVLPFKNSPSDVGDVVLAIGNPFGVGQTVTQGI
ncbi:MAG: serine protease, partial [Moraxellaceae bacterium]